MDLFMGDVLVRSMGEYSREVRKAKAGRSEESDQVEELVTGSTAGLIKAVSELRQLVKAGIRSPEMRARAAYALAKCDLEAQASRQFALKAVGDVELTNAEREVRDCIAQIRQSQANAQGPGIMPTGTGGTQEMQIKAAGDGSAASLSPGEPDPSSRVGGMVGAGRLPEPAVHRGEVANELDLEKALADAHGETPRALAAEALTLYRLEKAAKSPVEALEAMLSGRSRDKNADLLEERKQVNEKIQGLEKQIAGSPAPRGQPHVLAAALVHARLEKSHLEGDRR
jgi:hypothetical protein